MVIASLLNLIGVEPVQPDIKTTIIISSKTNSLINLIFDF